MRKPHNVSWNLKQLSKMIDNGTIRFDHPIQRSGEQWKPEQKSFLVHSVIEGYPIFPIYFLSEEVQTDKGTSTIRYVLDGKQRLTELKAFYDNQFALHEDTPDVTIEGIGEDGSDVVYQIAGLTFHELPEDVQDEFLTFMLLTYTIDGKYVEDEEIENLFYRMNSATSLSTSQKMRAIVGMEWAKKLNEVLLHPLFEDGIAAFSKTQIKSDSHLAAILQTMMMMDDYNYKDVSESGISEYAKTFKSTTETKEMLFQKVVKGMDYLTKAFQNRETLLLKKVNFPMTLMTAIKAVELDVKPHVFQDWSHEFRIAFKATESVGFFPTNYADFSGPGSVRKQKADGRKEEMLRHFENYINHMSKKEGEI